MLARAQAANANAHAPSSDADVSSSSSQAATPALQLPADFSTWIGIYPCYLDASKTVAEGRRVAKTIAVESPPARCIAQACAELGFPTTLEMKTHPRAWMEPGRVRVRLLTAERKAVVTGLTSKKQLLRAICEKLPPLVEEVNRQMAEAEQKAREEEESKMNKSEKKKAEKKAEKQSKKR